MSPIRIAAIVEGDGETGALPMLIHRIADEAGLSPVSAKQIAMSLFTG